MGLPFDLTRFFENAAGPVAILIMLLLIAGYGMRLCILHIIKPQQQLKLEQAKAEAVHRRRIEERQCARDERLADTQEKTLETLAAHSGQQIELLGKVSGCMERGEVRDERTNQSLKTCENGIAELLRRGHGRSAEGSG
jgi:hypothetical protein